MSHYTHKNPCKKCGSYEYNCGCPAPKAKPNKNWIVLEQNLEVKKVADYDKLNNGNISGRLWCVEFKTKKDAEEHRMAIIKSRILRAKEEIKELEALMKR